ncbi:DUF397 domain-containing protein [Streptomyces sp. NPDC006267]
MTSPTSQPHRSPVSGAIRDSKNPGGPALLIPAESFAAFMAAVRAGTFDI